MKKVYIVPGMDTPARAESVKKALLSLKDVLFVDTDPESAQATLILFDGAPEPSLQKRGLPYSLLPDSPGARLRARTAHIGCSRFTGLVFTAALSLCLPAALVSLFILPGGSRTDLPGQTTLLFLQALTLFPFVLLRLPAAVRGARAIVRKEGGFEALALVSFLFCALQGCTEWLFTLFSRSAFVGFAPAALCAVIAEFYRLTVFSHAERSDGNLAALRAQERPSVLIREPASKKAFPLFGAVFPPLTSFCLCACAALFLCRDAVAALSCGISGASACALAVLSASPPIAPARRLRGAFALSSQLLWTWASRAVLCVALFSAVLKAGKSPLPFLLTLLFSLASAARALPASNGAHASKRRKNAAGSPAPGIKRARSARFRRDRRFPGLRPK